MNSAQLSYLVEILLPKESGNGQPVRQKWFEDLLKELTGSLAAPPAAGWGQGLWRSGGETQRDHIAVIEVALARLGADGPASRIQVLSVTVIS